MKNPNSHDSAAADAKQQYAEEARRRWGHTEEYAQSVKKTAVRSADEQSSVEHEAEEIFAAFAECRQTEAPDSAAAQALVKRWQEHISQNYYICTDEILGTLGEMYTADERFTQNLDRYGEGTAQFMHDAVRAYCRKSKAPTNH